MKEQPERPEQRVYSISDFCTAYAVSRTRCYGEINAGRLRARRIGGRVMIARDDADAWFAAMPEVRAEEAA